jgi:hypothetical protein
LKRLSRYLTLVTALIASVSASGADLRGTVLNGTTRRPAAGDEVVLLSLSQDGMNESARTKTDPLGHFSVIVTDTQASHVVRVVHQGVTYHKVAGLGVKSVTLDVYDVSEKVEGVTAVMDVQRFEATGETLEVKQLITMRNASKPPRTLMNARPFEISLPAEAQVESGLVQIENGQPLKQKPIRGEQAGHYYFSSPIRPGDTRFAVIYRLPYNGEARITPNIRNPLERFVVMLPQSMKFEPMAPGVFRPMPGTSPDNVQGTAPVSADQTLTFNISGMGALEELGGRRQQAQENQATQKPRPGGGLGPPIDAPDPLQGYRWQIFGGLIVLVAAGALSVTRKTKLPAVARNSRSSFRAQSRTVEKPTRIEMNGRHRRRVPESQRSR